MALQSTTIYSNQVGAYTLYLALTEESADVTTNTSIVSWRLGMTRTSANRFNQYRCGYAVYLNGSRVAYLERDNPSYYIGFSSNSVYDITITSGSTAIAHNADGSLNLSASASLDIARDSYGPGPMSLTGSWALTTIPRASSLSASNGILGTAQTLTVTRQASSFTHTITYRCGSASGTIVSNSSATSISWTPPLSLASQNTTGTSVQITLTITTYNGSTSVGSKTTSISAAIPSSVVPAVSLVVSDNTGNFSEYGAFIQGQSVLKLSASATPAYGSPIRSYSLLADGKSYSSASVTASATISNSGTLTATARATDARGRTSAQASQSFTVIPWQRPSAVASAVRCNSDGTANETGLYAKITFSASISPVSNKNTAAYSVRYRPEGSSTWTTVNVTDQAGNYTVTNASIIFTAPETTAFEVQVIAQDAFTSTTAYASVSVAFRLINAAPAGHDIAFGMMSGDGRGFEVNMDATFYGNMIFPNGSPFAPSGYGLGGVVWTENLDGKYDTGFFTWTEGTSGAPFTWGTVQVIKRDGNRSVQIAFSPTGMQYNNAITVRSSSSAGTWSEWEWVNPPMQAGVEYRTIERSNGKVVYAKRISYTNSAEIGDASGVALVSIPHEISGFGELVRVSGLNYTANYPLPYIGSTGGITAVAAVNSTSVRMRIKEMTWTGGSYYTWYFDVYYTK